MTDIFALSINLMIHNESDHRSFNISIYFIVHTFPSLSFFSDKKLKNNLQSLPNPLFNYN